MRPARIYMVRAATVGTAPRFVRMIRELIEERMSDSPQRLAMGALGPSLDVCPEDCCVMFQPAPLVKQTNHTMGTKNTKSSDVDL